MRQIVASIVVLLFCVLAPGAIAFGKLPISEATLNALKLIQVKTGIPSENFAIRGSWEYRELNSPWQLNPPASRPIAFVLPRDESEVAALVHWATQLGLHFVAKGGGHSFEKYSYGDPVSIVIDLRLLDTVTLDMVSGTVAVGAGQLLGPLAYKLWASGNVLLPSADCPTVGIAGSALGGGLGRFAAAYGLSLDNILEMNVVDAKGRLLVVNPRSHGDLFWALRGGGPSFGIVTKFLFRTYPAPPLVFQGSLTFNMSQFVVVADAFQRLLARQTATSRATFDLNMSAATVSLHMTDISGKGHNFRYVKSLFPPPSNSSEAVYAFPDFLLYQAKELSSELLRNDTVLDTPSDMAKLTRSSSLPVHQTRKSFYVQKLLDTDELVSLQTIYQEMPPYVAAWFEGYGGAVRAMGVNDTAFVHRGDTLFNAVMSYKMPLPSILSDIIGANLLDQFWELGTQLGAAESYQNYVDADLENYLERYYGDSLEKLVQIKAKYDPQNVFRFQQSVPTLL